MGNENLNWLFSTEDCNIALSKSLYQVPLDACYKCGGNTILRSRDHRILIGIDHAALHFIHNQCDALITYTPDMRKYFSEKNQKKLFVAYNTLNFTDIDKETVPDKEITKKKYGISENKVILYISRMMPYKRVDG